jgi:hypothetical protein
MPNMTRISKNEILMNCEITKKEGLFMLKKRTLSHEDFYCAAKLSYWQL